MPVVTFNRDYLFGLLPKGTTPESVRETSYKMGFETERITEKEVSIEITPNRPDLYSAIGFARAYKNFEHKSKRLKYELQDASPEFSITIGKEAAAVRPFIAGIVAHGISLSGEALPDLINFSEKLSETYGRSRKKIAIGLHDLSKMEPPLHYNAYEDEKYIPLNEKKERLFSDVLKGSEKGSKYGHILRGTGRYPALKDRSGVISLIPILNSERTRVTNKTKNLFVDITGMYREPVEKTADMMASIFEDMGASVRPVSIIYSGSERLTPSLEKRYLSIPLSMAESEIGISVGYNNIISLANKAGYEAALVGNEVRFRVPEYRMDVINEQDIVEDIAIAYGYDFINPLPVASSQAGSLLQDESNFETLSEEMLGMGFSEAVNTYLTNESLNFAGMRINDISSYLASEKIGCITLKNSKSASLTMMRTWLLPSLLRNLGSSVHESMPQRLFELDMAFAERRKKISEEYHLAAVSAGPKANLNEIKSVLEEISYLADMQFKARESEHGSFIKGRCAEIILHGAPIGIFGELHPEVLHNFGIEEPVCAFEINLDLMYDEEKTASSKSVRKKNSGN